SAYLGDSRTLGNHANGRISAHGAYALQRTVFHAVGGLAGYTCCELRRNAVRPLLVHLSDQPVRLGERRVDDRRGIEEPAATAEDRKSTRLNSSHVKISYAVFCLKKK